MGLKRGRPTGAMHALSCLALAGLTRAATAAVADTTVEASAGGSSLYSQRLGVVVPAHHGDIDKAVSSLSRWPTECSPVTQQNVDLVLYYAEGEEDVVAADAISTIASTAGRCFASTRLVYANLDKEVSSDSDGGAHSCWVIITSVFGRRATGLLVQRVEEYTSSIWLMARALVRGNIRRAPS